MINNLKAIVFTNILIYERTTLTALSQDMLS